MKSSRRSECAKLVLAALCLLAGPAHGLSTDSQQPVQIEADFAELDDEAHTTVYIGNVIVDQGSIHMTGDRLRVNFTENKELKDAYLEGRPATFKQTPDNDDDVHGQAMQIEYHQQESLLKLIEKARATQGERLFEGHIINYDTKKSLITARSARADNADKDSQSKEGSGRVRIIIPPKKRAADYQPSDDKAAAAGGAKTATSGASADKSPADKSPADKGSTAGSAQPAAPAAGTVKH